MAGLASKANLTSTTGLIGIFPMAVADGLAISAPIGTPVTGGLRSGSAADSRERLTPP